MLEQVLERIAVALETLVAREAGTPIPTAKKQKVAPAAPVDAIPGDDIPGDDVPGAEEATVLLCRGVTDTAALRDFTQKALTAAGTKANDLVTFIKGEVCAKFTPNEPKLIKIPQANVAVAAQMIYNWCLKNKIILEG